MSWKLYKRCKRINEPLASISSFDWTRSRIPFQGIGKKEEWKNCKHFSKRLGTNLKGSHTRRAGKKEAYDRSK